MNKKQKTFYITTPIFYPSGNLHIGHVYTTTLAWCLKQYKTLRGYDAIMLTGADEHGQKIEQKAKELNLLPQKYVNKMTKVFINLWNSYDIYYDFYSRTTNKNHKKVVQDIFTLLLNKDLIYKSQYKGLYSIQDEEFLTKTQAKKVDGKYYHPGSNHELEEVAEESYFLRTSQFADWLLKYYQENQQFVLPKKIVKELSNNFLLKGLEDLSITRNTFKWSIPIREDNNHVIYVWLDALNNYITSLGYGQKEDENFQKYWVNGDEIIHIVGKEITRFHCIYWPIILKMLDLRQPKNILVPGWIVTPEGKMSKSKGNVVDPLKLLKKYDNETIKYYLVSQIKMGQDGVFDEELLTNTYNANLANNFGNLLSRTIAMTLQNFQTPIQYRSSDLAVDLEIIEAIKIAQRKYIEYFDAFKVDSAFEVAIHLSKQLNGYIDKTTPWLLTENLDRLEIVLNNLLNGIYAVSTFLSVVMPKKMEAVLKQLNLKKFDLEMITKFDKFDNRIVKKSEILFQRIK